MNDDSYNRGPQSAAGATREYSREGVAARLRCLVGGSPLVAFAHLVGVHPEKLRRVLRGDNELPLSALVAIGKSLGVSAEWLVFGHGPLRAREVDSLLCNSRFTEGVHELTRAADAMMQLARDMKPPIAPTVPASSMSAQTGTSSPASGRRLATPIVLAEPSDSQRPIVT